MKVYLYRSDRVAQLTLFLSSSLTNTGIIIGQKLRKLPGSNSFRKKMTWIFFIFLLKYLYKFKKFFVLCNKIKYPS